jgi:hypothetical protein
MPVELVELLDRRRGGEKSNKKLFPLRFSQGSSLLLTIRRDYQTLVAGGGFARTFWTGRVDQMSVLLLAVRGEDLLHDEEVKLVGVAAISCAPM